MRTLLSTDHFFLCCLLFSNTLQATAQGSKADYERAAEVRQRFIGKVKHTRQVFHWVDDQHALWFRDSEGYWNKIKPDTGVFEHAFNHEQLGLVLNQAIGKSFSPTNLPIDRLRVVDADSFYLTSHNQAWVYNKKSGELVATEWIKENKFRPRVDRLPAPVWNPVIKDHNVLLTPVGRKGQPENARSIQLTTDGTEDNSYRRFEWSPDRSKLTLTQRKAGDTRHVSLIDTTPDQQFQPKNDRYFYLKPGDKVAVDRPVLFDIETKQKIAVSIDLAPNPYHIRGVRWKKDSSAFTYLYNQRGHQVYRVIEVDAATGKSRAVISEEPETFFTYSSKMFLHYLDDTDEILWMSERDGWNHLYLYDWKTGEVKRQITKGEWVVRKVDRVDEASRTVWFWVGGIHAGQDPYHLHYCRVNMDTGEVTPLTASDGTHTDVSISPDGKRFVTTWSRVDHAPVHELRSAETGELIKEIGRADASKLVNAGWVAPERFVAKGRDGETDIYGIIIKPTNFDPNKKYPVIEQIYAGPHGQHVPKKFYGMHRNMQLAELGFIIVQIDGMGTNWRSKAFHGVAWKNLKDAGFPDRIAWMKVAAEDRPWMDLSRVGIYGGSAGGQNAMRAVLDHADFYKAAAADCGCHDNRMDKIWWNEQWMGYPVDQSYIDSSNSEDAHKLGGKLLLTVGELDRNVDPASTMQVVDALIKADKDFEYMVFPGRGHGAGESNYGQRLRADFFVRHLMGKTPRW